MITLIDICSSLVNGNLLMIVCDSRGDNDTCRFPTVTYYLDSYHETTASGSMCPTSIYLAPKVPTKGLLLGQSVYYLCTWTLTDGYLTDFFPEASRRGADRRLDATAPVSFEVKGLGDHTLRLQVYKYYLLWGLKSLNTTYFGHLESYG